MDGEKERERERGEEKESDEAEDFSQAMEGAALEWQERYPKDDLGLPIMHWEALGLRIAELEKQEEDRRSKSAIVLEHGRVSRGWIEEREQESQRETLEDGVEDDSRITALTSRLQTQMNLQLCFINNSESEDEDDDREAGREKSQVVAMTGHGSVQQLPSHLTNDMGRIAGLQIDHEEKKHPACCEAVMEQRRLKRGDLLTFSLKQLTTLRASLDQAIQDLSSELVGRLLTRDQLRTEQDAILLEVQDMTSLRCDDQRSPCNITQ
ncbi:schwannomin-interacting protein 1 [Conger conger]|uniref:schwannomin-interacting protein 1 n=1 Tax=Conger conger TaxID=82655 RepID=UPI002A599D22|nr:schwannomin-interacting protein 1 [Conger conger]XP_061092760.1 schwannomin-interacting protein 1 [Conger conger]XP_061092762.1 schwannomin-interacting protein 1 [Conger conger]